MKDKCKVAGIVLAGGRSKRMGRNKVYLSFGGKFLIEIIIDKISPLFKDIMIVVSQPELYKRLGFCVRKDIIPEKGPLGGIYTGLLYSNNRYNFVVACDMPFLNPNLIRYMIKNCQCYDIVVPEYKKA